MKRNALYNALRVWGYAMLMASTVVVSSASLTKTAFAAQKVFNCNPDGVAMFPTSRIHVRCSPGDGSILFFALGVSNSAEANRVLSIISTALVTKRKLQIWYDPADVSGASIGCQTNDCRLILGVQML
jgi:endo-1,4-beta-D-glucanase Y